MVEINNTTAEKIARPRLICLVNAFLKKYHKIDYDVSLAFIGPVAMRRLNERYRGINKSTDILSFPNPESGKLKNKKSKYLGEIVINPQALKRLQNYRDILLDYQASSGKLLSPAANRRYLWGFIVVHGLLHLIGYNDETEKERRHMLNLGHKFLAKKL